MLFFCHKEDLGLIPRWSTSCHRHKLAFDFVYYNKWDSFFALKKMIKISYFSKMMTEQLLKQSQVFPYMFIMLTFTDISKNVNKWFRIRFHISLVLSVSNNSIIYNDNNNWKHYQNRSPLYLLINNLVKL